MVMDVLVVAAPAVAAASSVLKPKQLRELGIEPALVSVTEHRPPYRLRVQLQKVCNIRAPLAAQSHSGAVLSIFSR